MNRPDAAAEVAGLGGVSVDESDMPVDELSEQYVPDDEQEPVDHGD